MKPRRARRLNRRFKDHYFKPRGIPMNTLEEVVITFEEIEALRLRYLDGMKQVDAASKMGLSQSQYQRDLWESHKKITDALISGKAIKVEEYNIGEKK